MMFGLLSDVVRPLTRSNPESLFKMAGQVTLGSTSSHQAETKANVGGHISIDSRDIATISHNLQKVRNVD